MQFRFALRPFGADEGDVGRLARRILTRPDLRAALDQRRLDSGDHGERNRTAHLARGRPIVVAHPQRARWSSGGDAALVDGIRGSIDYRGGDWQGYETSDLDVVVDLGELRAVSSVKVGFLHRPGSGIFLPGSVEVAVSADGERYEAAGRVTGIDPPADAVTRWYAPVRLSVPRARFVRVRATNVGRRPAGGAGDPAWLFVDEVIVR
jgi:hexosaminidase